MTGPVELGWGALAIAASLIAVNGLLSVWLKLGLEKKLAVASLRTLVQLTLLGYVLLPVFSANRWWWTLLVIVVIALLSGTEAVRRTDRTYVGIRLTSTLAMVVGCVGTGLIGLFLVIGVDPWWEPRYAIPLVGMLLGNALSGVSLGIDRALSLLDEHRDRVEHRLAFGATWWEAARPVASEAVRTGMIPILNSMSAVGLITIPGMMTGQLLGGTDPVQASRYQIIIMFLIACAVAIGTGMAVLGTLWRMFDEDHRLRVDRILT